MSLVYCNIKVFSFILILEKSKGIYFALLTNHKFLVFHWHVKSSAHLLSFYIIGIH